MKIDILTIFPEMFKGVFSESILKIAQKKKVVRIRITDIRKYSRDKHKKVDDKPYGGGPGMVMSVGPIFEAVKAVIKKSRTARKKPRIILLSPRGKKFDQAIAKDLSKESHLILICGRYEGVDERLSELLQADELSVGDYILTGGELPAMIVTDAITRLLKGALGNADSAGAESFEKNLLEYPHYTRPADFMGKKIPKVLLSGDHKKIAAWRKLESEKITKLRRPDLLKGFKP